MESDLTVHLRRCCCLRILYGKEVVGLAVIFLELKSTFESAFAQLEDQGGRVRTWSGCGVNLGQGYAGYGDARKLGRLRKAWFGNTREKNPSLAKGQPVGTCFLFPPERGL